MLEITIKLLLFLLPLAYSPGPGNMFFAANGARFGFASTLSANTGYHIATLIATLAIGLGFGLIATKAPIFLMAIRYLGAAYVLYLAWCLFKAGAYNDKAIPRHATFADGAILLVLNPKAYLIIVLMFSQFTNTDDAPQFIFFIAIVFTVNNFLAFLIWAYLADRLASHFRSENNAQYLNRVFGAMLAVVAVWMVF